MRIANASENHSCRRRTNRIFCSFTGNSVCDSSAPRSHVSVRCLQDSPETKKLPSRQISESRGRARDGAISQITTRGSLVLDPMDLTRVSPFHPFPSRRCTMCQPCCSEPMPGQLPKHHATALLLRSPQRPCPRKENDRPPVSDPSGHTGQRNASSICLTGSAR